jgi:glycosyltransferase involved in cell wall biosynthesis
LFLIPLSFPFSKSQEDTFLKHEIVYLKKTFSNFIILPKENIGTRLELDKSFSVDESFAEFNREKKSSITSIIFNFLFYKILLFEIFSNPLLLVKFSELRKLLSFIKNTIETKNFFRRYLSIYNEKDDELTIYTYWATYITLALGILSKKNSKISVITRMHGSDLYEERGFVVCQKQILKNIRYVFFVSENGRNYLQKKYDLFKDKFRFAPIGVEKQSKLNPWKFDETLRLVSCSSIDNNKRVELIYEALLLLAESGRMINWTHFGSGENEKKLYEKINENSYPNLNCILMGYVSSESLMRYYEDNQVDIFITTSASEGGRPVSIQEALSFGIPIVATSVGGISELVNSENGILLSPDPKPSEVSEAIRIFYSNKDFIYKMRQASHLKWSQSCDKDKNFENFIWQLKELGLC